jgi:hypothetical protein
MKKFIYATLTLITLAAPAISQARCFPAPHYRPAPVYYQPAPVYYLPVTLASYCVTPFGTWPMAAVLPIGATCEAVTPQGVFFGVAQ